MTLADKPTELILASQIKVGDVTVRQGNHGDIYETVVSAEHGKFFVSMVVECDGKRYDMHERNSKTVRRIKQ